MTRAVYLVFFFAMSITVACNNPGAGQHSAAGATVERLSVQDFAGKLANSRQIIDVRSPEEFAVGHIEHASNVDVNSGNFDQAMRQLDKKQPVLLYCQSGGRSHRAAERLHEQGFDSVYELQGGIGAWRDAGKPVNADHHQ